MEGPEVERKLAAILAADVVAYSRLMEADEEGTLAALKALRSELLDPAIAAHHGHLVKTTGDGLLVEFPSVVEAVRCAVEVQRAIGARNQDVPQDSAIVLRIGVNLGDVIVDGDDIYGDGVNVAARLEGLAEPGTVCVSGTVHEHAAGKLGLVFEDLGEHEVKNIEKPVRVYRVLPEAAAAMRGATRGRLAGRRWPWAAAAVIVVAIAVAVAGHQGLFPLREPAPEALRLPDKPSIAVLPFVNMSGDEEQEYFSDGMAEDIITDLSKISGLFVIARNSSFTYKGRAVKVQDVSRELGVRYVLEGSVRRANDRLRITAQLVDATTGAHLWAERYDGEMSDVFALQDRITERIVAALAVSLTEAEQNRAMAKPTANLDAYDYVLRGAKYHQRLTRESNARAKEMFERALALDPDYAEAYAGLGWVHVHDFNMHWTANPAASIKLAFENASRAVALDPHSAKAHMVRGDALLWMGRNDEAVAAGHRSIELDPSYADAHMMLSIYLGWAGEAEGAIGEARAALRLNPSAPIWAYHWALGHALFTAGRYAEAVQAFEIAVTRDSEAGPPRWSSISTYGHLGREKDAQTHLEAFAKIVGAPVQALTVQGMTGDPVPPFKDPADLKRLREGFRKAGLPKA